MTRIWIGAAVAIAMGAFCGCCCGELSEEEKAALAAEKPAHQESIAAFRTQLEAIAIGIDAFGELQQSTCDAAVFSAPAYARNLAIPQALISPSIDPLSDKNRELTQEEISEVFQRFRLDPGRPTLTQISRFDYLKDPFGVVKVYQMVKKYVDCQLILAGGGAVDDPEGELVYRQVLEQTSDDPDIHVLLLPPSSNIEINAFQRGSTVILQKSLREGFGLTVAEGLWKAKPVVASAVGGIPRQIVHRFSGILTHTIEGTAYWVRQILQSPEYAAYLGKNGKEYIRQRFLITRHIRDYLLLILSLSHPGEDIINL